MRRLKDIDWRNVLLDILLEYIPAIVLIVACFAFFVFVLGPFGW